MGRASGKGASAMEELFEVDDASLTDVQQALADGRTNSTVLTQAYLTRIAAYDHAGARPQLGARG
jgi:hypothetical protein